MKRRGSLGTTDSWEFESYLNSSVAAIASTLNQHHPSHYKIAYHMSMVESAKKVKLFTFSQDLEIICIKVKYSKDQTL